MFSSTYLKLVIVFLVAFGLSFFLSEILETKLLNLSILVFGLFLAFSLDNRKKRIEVIKEVLRDADSKLLNLDQISKSFNKKTGEEIKAKIEVFLIAQLDYKLVDIEHSRDKLHDLIDFVIELKPKTEEETNAKEDMIRVLFETRSIMKKVAYNVKSRMTSQEWSALLLLFGLVVFLIYQENASDLIYGKILTSIIIAALAFFIFILRDLDILRWQAGDWIWRPLVNLFKDLGLVPYLPEPVFREREKELRKMKDLKEVRVAMYKYPYPDFREKEVKVIQL